ncbi:putative endochitinase [Branchiostoma floridae x Branchiostoma japonicum]
MGERATASSGQSIMADNDGPPHTADPYTEWKCAGKAAGRNYQDPDDCSKFYTCLGGQIYSFSCPTGRLFDAERLLCDEADNVYCLHPISADPGPDPACAGKVDGKVFGDPDDCTKFHTCSSGQLSKFSCPTGLVFNQERLMCDKAENSKCL